MAETRSTVLAAWPLTDKSDPSCRNSLAITARLSKSDSLLAKENQTDANNMDPRIAALGGNLIYLKKGPRICSIVPLK